MNLKSLGILTLLLGIFYLMYNSVGLGVTTCLLSIILLVQAIIFSFKPEYYDRFLRFMNPGLYSSYSKKGSEFIRKKRRMNIISYYILSAVTGLNAFMQIRVMTKINIRPFSLREFSTFVPVILGIAFLMNYISIITMKKSKTANEDLAWNIIIGIVVAIILIGIVSFYVIRAIL